MPVSPRDWRADLPEQDSCDGRWSGLLCVFKGSIIRYRVENMISPRGWLSEPGEIAHAQPSLSDRWMGGKTTLNPKP